MTIGPKTIFLNLSFIVGFACIGLLYGKMTEPVYEGFGSLVIRRAIIENPASHSPDVRNRWVWIRDGLALKAEIVTDDFLVQLMKNNPFVKERYKKFRRADFDREAKFVEMLRSKIKISYTGADDNVYKFKFRDGDRMFAKRMVAVLMKRVKEIFQKNSAAIYRSVLDELEAKRKVKGLSVDMKASLDQAYEKVLVGSLIAKAEIESKVVFIENPRVQNQAVWPRTGPLTLVSAALGLLFSLLVNFLRIRVRVGD